MNLKHSLLRYLLLTLMLGGLGHPVFGETDPWRIWKQPGVQAIMRHATAPGVGDPDNFILGRCETQRNLNAQGLEESKALG